MFQVYHKLFDLLTQRERRRLLLLVGLVIVMGLVDAVGVASILPFLAAVADPAVTETNRFFTTLRALLGIVDTDRFIVVLGFLVFAVFAISIAFKILTLFALARFSHMQRYSLAMRLFEGYLRQPYVWFLNRHSADLGKAILSEVDVVVNGTMVPATQVVAQTVSVLFLFVLLLSVEPVIAVSALVVLGGTYILLFLLIRGWMTQIGIRRTQTNQARFVISQEAMGSMKDVKLRGLEPAYIARFRQPAREFAEISAVNQIVGEVPRHVLEGIAFGGILLLVLVLLMGSGGTVADVIPTLGLFALAGLRMFPALQMIYRSMTSMRFNAPTLDLLHRDMCEIRQIEGASAAGDGCPIPLTEAIELRDVRYAYPGTAAPVLDGLSLEIRANTTVGIVGGTGAGKTTAVDIILGLLLPDAGSLRVDGQDISRDRLPDWQRSIGYVPQQVFLVDDTVSANIAFGIDADSRDQSRVEAAARLASLDDFVRTLPEGYDTRVGERGVRLSGGQRQRIAIARALYHDPDVLVLDEATSALDNLTERAVMEAVANLGHSKTIIMIAHRLSTVRNCDTIFMLENGRLVASGTYDELLQSNSTFRNMATGT